MECVFYVTIYNDMECIIVLSRIEANILSAYCVQVIAFSSLQASD